MNKIIPIKNNPISLLEILFFKLNNTFEIIIMINNRDTTRNEKTDNCRYNGNSLITADKSMPLI